MLGFQSRNGPFPSHFFQSRTFSLQFPPPPTTITSSSPLHIVFPLPNIPSLLHLYISCLSFKVRLDVVSSGMLLLVLSCLLKLGWVLPVFGEVVNQVNPSIQNVWIQCMLPQEFQADVAGGSFRHHEQGLPLEAGYTLCCSFNLLHMFVIRKMVVNEISHWEDSSLYELYRFFC